jgi:dihydroorotase
MYSIANLFPYSSYLCTLMGIIIKKITILDASSLFYHKQVDILVENNTIVAIQEGIAAEAHTIIEGDSLHALPGFVDLLANIGEPGYEQHETLKHADKAALHGGYAYVFTTPFNKPTIDNASAVMTMKQLMVPYSTLFNTMGSLVKGSNPNELANMLEMHEQGVQLFTLPMHTTVPDAVLIKGMEFITSINGTLVVIPAANDLFPNGQMHEGVQSASLGMKGFPAMAEELVVKKIIQFAQYTKAKVHIACISTLGSIQLIQEAKQQNIPVTCSVTPNHLLYTDASLEMYDTHYKLNPPLRTEADRLALIKGLEAGIIDSIISCHTPVHADYKDGEFDKAAFGTTGLQTAFYMVRKAMPNAGMASIIKWFSTANAAIANITIPTIAVGQKANFAVLQNKPWILDGLSYQSKSLNNPMLGEVFNEYIQLFA